MAHDEEIGKAVSAVRSLFRGETVPPPPRYWEDEGGLNDLMRAAGWVAHAMFEPDTDDDQVLSILIYDPACQDAIPVPTSPIDADGERLLADCWSMSSVLNAISRVSALVSHGVRPDQAAIPAFGNFALTGTPEQGEEFIEHLSRYLRGRGRLSANGGWPALTPEDRTAARILIEGLAGRASGDSVRVLVTDRSRGVSGLVYPTRAATRDEMRMAAVALERLGRSVEAVGRAHRIVHDTIAARERAAQDAKRSNDLAREGMARLLEEHGPALRELAAGDRPGAPRAILHLLESGKRLPAYKGTRKFPSPEQDALIDELHAFLGEGAHEILVSLVRLPHRPGMNPEAVEGLGRALAAAIRPEAESPGAR